MSNLSNTVKLHVEDSRTNAPALVFLHYWGGSSRTWRHVIDALTPAFRTVAVDQRGWGRSDKPLDGYTLTALADDAQSLIEAQKALELTASPAMADQVTAKEAQVAVASAQLDYNKK